MNALLKAKPTTYGELTSNPAVHGLEPPSLRVTLRQGDKSTTVNLGKVTFGGTKAVVFATTSTRKRPMAVPRSDLAAVFKDTGGRTDGESGDLAKWTSDFRVKRVFSVSPQATIGDTDRGWLRAPGRT